MKTNIDDTTLQTKCVCGSAETPNVTHRKDGPCHVNASNIHKSLEEVIGTKCLPSQMPRFVAEKLAAGQASLDSADAVDWKSRHDELQKAYAEHAEVTAALHARAEKTESVLANLLAIIHRDGGHYQAEHGTEKAVEEAHQELSRCRDLKRENEAMREALKDSQSAISAFLCFYSDHLTNEQVAPLSETLDKLRHFL